MEFVRAFTPLMVMWVSLLGTVTACTFAVTSFRRKGLPPLDPLIALLGSVAALYFSTMQGQYPFAAGLLLFLSGFGAFSASALSLAMMKEAALPRLDDQLKS